MPGSDSQYAVNKMMMLSERVRPCDPRKKAAVAPTVVRTTRNMASSSSPRQLRHRVVLTPAVELSPESSSVTSVGYSSRQKPAFSASYKTGTNLYSVIVNKDVKDMRNLVRNLHGSLSF